MRMIDALLIILPKASMCNMHHPKTKQGISCRRNKSIEKNVRAQLSHRFLNAPE